MHDQSPIDRITPLPHLTTNLLKTVPSALHDGCETSWTIIGIPALLAVPPGLVKKNHIVLLPNCGHHDKHTAVILSSYLNTLTDYDDRIDVKHDPTQPSDVEKRVYGHLVATHKAQKRWLQMVVRLTSSEYPSGVEQACRDYTHRKGWKEDLDELVLLYDISVSACSKTFTPVFSISHEV